jgi:hypothetical protein
VTLLLAMIVAALASLATPVSARAPAGAEPAPSSG